MVILGTRYAATREKAIRVCVAPIVPNYLVFFIFKFSIEYPDG